MGRSYSNSGSSCGAENGEWHILPGRLSILGKTMHNRSRLRYLCDTQ
jgi:hypothetical protein